MRSFPAFHQASSSAPCPSGRQAPRFRLASQLRRGFTLIEILIVVGIIGILTAVVVIAVNPAAHLGSARDAQRRTDVTSILNAVYQYSIDHQRLPPEIPTGTEQEVCKTGRTGGFCRNGIDLSLVTASGLYLVQMPVDPQVPDSETGTDYLIRQDLGNLRITVTAVRHEQTDSISASR